MNKLIFTTLSLFIAFSLSSQCYNTQAQNYRNYRIQNEHRINHVFPGYIDVTGFQIPEGSVFENPEKPLFSTFFLKGLWMSGYDPADNLKLSAISFNSGGQSDYDHIPVEDWDEILTPQHCAFYDHVWVVKKSDIIQLKYLFETNQLNHENINPDILFWPAKGNPWISEVPLDYDIAPFYDFNTDGIYNPMDGDYPICLEENKDFIPFEFSFNLFSDNTIHTLTSSVSIQAEVHQLNYVLNCRGNKEGEKTVFTRLKIINKATTSIHDFRIGLWEYSKLGCPDNEFHGCDTISNSVFTYNKDGIDLPSPCPSGVQSIHDYGVIASTVFLNSNLESYIYAIRDSNNNLDPKNAAPETTDQFQSFLSGKWRDDSDMTIGGLGLDEQSEKTKFAFPDFPNNPNGWSMQNAITDRLYDIQTISTFHLIDLNPGESITLDIANHFIYDSTELTLKLFDQYQERIGQVKETYDKLVKGESVCDDEIQYCVDDCIWPGDVNIDGIVNGHDIVLEGLMIAHESDQGNSRKFISNDWFPFESADWGSSYKSFDFKYADINGNGIINDNDLDEQKENYDKTWKSVFPEPRIPAEVEQTNLYQYISKDSIDLELASSFVHLSFSLRIELGEFGDILKDPIHGITWKMYADTNLLNTFNQTFPDGMDLYETSNFLGRQFGEHDYRSDDEFDVTFTRTDGFNYEEFTRLTHRHTFLLREDARTENPDRRDTIVFEISNIHALNANGDTVQIGVVYDSLIVTNLIYDPDLTTSTAEGFEVNNSDLKVYPNPASQVIHLEFKDLFSGKIEIFGVDGSLKMTSQTRNKKALALDIDNLPAGMYIIQTKSTNQNQNMLAKFIKHNE